MRKTFVSGLLALGAGTAAVGAYILVFLPWQRRWGATDEEVCRTLPGDVQVPNPDMQWTRAITIKAKVAVSNQAFSAGRAGESLHRLWSVFSEAQDAAGYQTAGGKAQ